MRNSAALWSLLALASAATLSLTACGDERPDPSEPDAGVSADATIAFDGSDSRLDAGNFPDAGEPADGSTSEPDAGPIGDGGLVRLRLMAGNITTGTLQNYNGGEGIRIFQALQPDITMIQEFNYGDKSEATIRAFVDTTFGADFHYYRESQPTDTIPNGIISRYPILEAGEWDDPAAINRDIAWARIDIPGPRDLWVVSVHLRTSNATARNQGATVAVTKLKEVMSPGDLLALGGDFNTGSRTEVCVTTLSELLSTAAPYPADQAGNSNTSAKRSSPLDWVLVSSDLRAYEVPVVIGANSFQNGLVFDSRVYTPLADVEPVLKTDSAATGMQHMAVVRDFELPQ